MKVSNSSTSPRRHYLPILSLGQKSHCGWHWMAFRSPGRTQLYLREPLGM